MSCMLNEHYVRVCGLETGIEMGHKWEIYENGQGGGLNFVWGGWGVGGGGGGWWVGWGWGVCVCGWVCVWGGCGLGVGGVGGCGLGVGGAGGCGLGVGGVGGWGGWGWMVGGGGGGVETQGRGFGFPVLIIWSMWETKTKNKCRVKLHFYSRFICNTVTLNQISHVNEMFSVFSQTIFQTYPTHTFLPLVCTPTFKVHLFAEDCHLYCPIYSRADQIFL